MQNCGKTTPTALICEVGRDIGKPSLSPDFRLISQPPATLTPSMVPFGRLADPLQCAPIRHVASDSGGFASRYEEELHGFRGEAFQDTLDMCDSTTCPLVLPLIPTCQIGTPILPSRHRPPKPRFPQPGNVKDFAGKGLVGSHMQRINGPQPSSISVPVNPNCMRQP